MLNNYLVMYVGESMVMMRSSMVIEVRAVEARQSRIEGRTNWCYSPADSQFRTRTHAHVLRSRNVQPSCTPVQMQLSKLVS